MDFSPPPPTGFAPPELDKTIDVDAVKGSMPEDGMLFLVGDKGGIASCIDAKTGEKIWAQRLGGNFGASPVIVGDKVLLISLDGMATVLSATKQFKKLGETDLGGPVGATPAYAGNRLLIRVDNELRCLKTKS